MWSRTFTVLIFLTMGVSNAWAFKLLPPPDCVPSKYSPSWSDCVGTAMAEPSGDIYVGEFKDGLMNGHGVLTSSDGNKYVGSFKDNKRNGYGRATYGNGTKYYGTWTDGKRNGLGTHYYSANTPWKGRKYVGQWKDNKMHGQGTLIYPNGEQQTGEFKNNKPIGSHKFVDKEGLPLSKLSMQKLLMIGK